ncbi:MAG: DUF1559 domain-containing protein [Planctomycetota bacterium]
MTDPVPDAESPAPRRRGLWAVMGQTASPEEAAAEESPLAPVEDSPTEESPPAPAAVEEATPSVPAPGRRGLWSLMRQTPTEPSGDPAAAPAAESAIEAAAIADNDAKESPAPIAPPRGLFSLMQRAANVEAQSDDDGLESWATPHSVLRTPHSPESPLTLTLSPQSRGEGTGEVGDQEEDYDEDREEEDLAPPLSTALIDPADLEPSRYVRAAAQAARQSWIGLACGVGAVAASALALLPQVWVGFPATGLGFAAIIAGYLTLTGAAGREMPISTRAASAAGMVFGTLGIFLGPLFFSGLGRDLREATGQQATGKHLTEIGVALNRHHDQHSAFPVGGVFTRDAAGVVKGQHGWMTFLLPFVNEQELYQSIVQDKPYDDPVNRAAMGRDVVTYFAAGGDRAKIVQGYAVSHFAGVGGEIDDATGLSHVGIFQRDEAVKKEEVTDGLSNTLVVGELAKTYPPWGDPENWRPIGRGLNKSVEGFGSAAGNGATFLLADGSVRFFNNQTDPKLLLKLSTRDGGEE